MAKSRALSKDSQSSATTGLGSYLYNAPQNFNKNGLGGKIGRSFVSNSKNDVSGSSNLSTSNLRGSSQQNNGLKKIIPHHMLRPAK